MVIFPSALARPVNMVIAPITAAATRYCIRASLDLTRTSIPSLPGALATKQSILSLLGKMDCFASLAMTTGSQPQNLLAVVEVGQQRRCRSLMKHRAALKREHPVGQ